jgi:hypothetical protein
MDFDSLYASRPTRMARNRDRVIEALWRRGLLGEEGLSTQVLVEAEGIALIGKV